MEEILPGIVYLSSFVGKGTSLVEVTKKKKKKKEKEKKQIPGCE